jgi:hypothetical protein
LSHQGAGLAQTTSHLRKDALALTHPEHHLVTLLEVDGQQLATPQMSGMSKVRCTAAQIASECRALFGIQARRSAASLAVTHPLEAKLFKLFGPPLHGAPIFAKEVGNLLAALATAQKQQPTQAMVVAGFIATGNLLLNRDPHDFSIGNFELVHTLSLSEIRRLKCKSIMRHYLCRHVYLCSVTQRVRIKVVVARKVLVVEILTIAPAL